MVMFRKKKQRDYYNSPQLDAEGQGVGTTHHQAVNQQEPTMAKEVAQQKQNTAVTTEEEIDAATLALLNEDKQGGQSHDQADNLVPLIYLLQPLSPQVMKGDAARIDGAEAGDIWLRNAEPPIVSGDTGILFQPCYFYKDIVEWIPDRGGFVGRHDISCLPNVELRKGWTGTLTDVKEVKDEDEPNAQPRYVRSSNNNEVVETRYFVGYVYPEVGQPMPFIIPLASTGHSFGKTWMFLINSQTLPNGKPCEASWKFFYRLRTTMKTNSKGSWYMYKVEKERMARTLEELKRGEALNIAFATGEKKADDEMMAQAGEAGAARAGAGEPLNNDENM